MSFAKKQSPNVCVCLRKTTVRVQNSITMMVLFMIALLTTSAFGTLTFLPAATADRPPELLKKQGPVDESSLDPVVEVLFFRPKGLAPSKQVGTRKVPRGLAGEEANEDSYQRLLHYMNTAEKWIDVAMFAFTDETVATALVRAVNERGVKVRVFVCAAHSASMVAAARKRKLSPDPFEDADESRSASEDSSYGGGSVDHFRKTQKVSPEAASPPSSPGEVAAPLSKRSRNGDHEFGSGPERRDSGPVDTTVVLPVLLSQDHVAAYDAFSSSDNISETEPDDSDYELERDDLPSSSSRSTGSISALPANSLVDFLQQRGVPVFRVALGRYRVMHNKFLIVDGTYLLVGSYNLSQKAHENNWENMLVLRDNVAIQSYETEFDRMWRKIDHYVKYDDRVLLRELRCHGGYEKSCSEEDTAGESGTSGTGESGISVAEEDSQVSAPGLTPVVLPCRTSSPVDLNVIEEDSDSVGSTCAMSRLRLRRKTSSETLPCRCPSMSSLSSMSLLSLSRSDSSATLSRSGSSATLSRSGSSVGGGLERSLSTLSVSTDASERGKLCLSKDRLKVLARNWKGSRFLRLSTALFLNRHPGCFTPLKKKCQIGVVFSVGVGEDEHIVSDSVMVTTFTRSARSTLESAVMLSPHSLLFRR